MYVIINIEHIHYLLNEPVTQINESKLEIFCCN